MTHIIKEPLFEEIHVQEGLASAHPTKRPLPHGSNSSKK